MDGVQLLIAPLLELKLGIGTYKVSLYYLLIAPLLELKRITV